MTHHADAQRAEFEAAYINIRKAESISLTERDVKDWILRLDESGIYADPNSRMAFALWQAARRVQVENGKGWGGSGTSMIDGHAVSSESDCMTCSSHGAVGNVINAEPCPDCTPRSHSMSQYASKDDMLKAVMAENEQLRAQLAAAQQVVPQGWKLVPAEPTKEWVSALGERGLRIGTLDSSIRDMLAAAPQPPEAATSGAAPEVSTAAPDTACDPSMQPELATLAAPVQLPEPAIPASQGVCCGNFTSGGYYMGQSEQVCCGCPDDAHPAYYTEHQVRQLLAAQQFTLDELAMLTRKLVQQLRKASPGDESAEKALDYLKRKGLAGNPLRATQEQRT